MPSGPCYLKGFVRTLKFQPEYFIFADCTNKWRGNPKQANVY